MTPFAIAGIQMEVSGSHENVTAMGRRLDLLMKKFPWVQMVLFSELCAFGSATEHAQPLPGPAESTFCQMAAYYGVWLVPGTLFERVADGIYNTAPVIAPDGHVIARARKLFPFRPYEVGVKAGSDFVVFDVPSVGRFGVSVCYDMWFPETTRTLAALGAEVILHPSLTDTTDRDIELAIARSSAAVNQCYFFDINGVGDGGVGRSIIVGPAGDVLHEAGAGREKMPIEVDLDRVRREREMGLRGLGQPLKSFRDRAVEFSVYQRAGLTEGYLRSLGPLVKPARAAGAGATQAVAHADTAELPHAENPSEESSK